MTAPAWMTAARSSSGLTFEEAAAKAGCTPAQYRTLAHNSLAPTVGASGTVDTAQLESFLAEPRVLSARLVALAYRGDRKAVNILASARVLGFAEEGGNPTVATAPPARPVARSVVAAPRPVAAKPKPIAVNDLADLRALGSALGLKGFESNYGAALVKPDTDVATLKALAREVGLKGFADAPDGRAG